MQLDAARRRGEDFGKYDYATRYEIEFQQLPAFRDMQANEYREMVLDLIREIEREGADERGDREVLGVSRILNQDPHEQPRKTKKSPAPILFFTSSKELRACMRDEYKTFLTDYRVAADRLITAQKIGGAFDPQVEFPLGSFPPALQFVGAGLPLPPPKPPSRLLFYAEDNSTTILQRGEIPVIRLPRNRNIISARLAPASEGEEPFLALNHQYPPRAGPD